MSEDAYRALWKTTNLQAASKDVPARLQRHLRVFAAYCEGKPIRPIMEEYGVAPDYLALRLGEVFMALTEGRKDKAWWRHQATVCDGRNYLIALLSGYSGLPESRIRHMPASVFTRLIEEWRDVEVETAE